MAGPFPTDEQVQTSSRCTETDTVWEKEARQATELMEENGSQRDKTSGQDLERSQLAGLRPCYLEVLLGEDSSAPLYSSQSEEYQINKLGRQAKQTTGA